MGSRDAIITILERTGNPRRFRTRPAHFELHPRPGSLECVPRELGADQVAFNDAGRHLYAFVALGAEGPVDQAESMLDSLTVSR
jgi:hypothetical protein